MAAAVVPADPATTPGSNLQQSNVSALSSSVRCQVDHNVESILGLELPQLGLQLVV